MLSLAMTLLILVLAGNLIYMNLRPDDPLLSGWEDYESVAFAGYQEQGEVMLVNIYASWCPTCKAQHDAFLDLEKQGKRPSIRAIRLDYDKNEAFRERYDIHATGYLIIFKGNKPIARQAGLTTAKDIEDFLDRFNGL